MNFHLYLEKLNNSEGFKNFMKENSDAYLCSGFFIVDKEAGKNQQQFDYYVPESKKTFSFKLHEEIKPIPLETFSDGTPERILLEENLDFEDIEEIIEKEMAKREIKSQIQKIFLSLISKDKKPFLIGTVFISMFGLIRVDIDLPAGKIVTFENKSVFDVLDIFRKK